MQDISINLIARTSFNIGQNRNRPKKPTLHARKNDFVLYLHSARSTLAPE
jgi:hypothetical protein